jgi:hypothetical protein
MRQNLGWAVDYNAIALPIAAGVTVPVRAVLCTVTRRAVRLSVCLVRVSSWGYERAEVDTHADNGGAVPGSHGTSGRRGRHVANSATASRSSPTSPPKYIRSSDAHPELEGKSSTDVDQPASTGGCCDTAAAEPVTAGACC